MARLRRFLRLPMIPRVLLLVALCGSVNAQSTISKTTKQVLNPVPPMLELFPDSEESAERTNIYSIRQTVALSDIPERARNVRIWISIPRDAKNQTLSDFSVDACPGKWKVVRDAERRGDFLFVEVDSPSTPMVEVVTSFQLTRRPDYVKLTPELAGPMTDSLRALLAEHLDTNAPHMQVTPEFQAIADEVCSKETNIAIQAIKILEHVAGTVDHYSYTKDPNMPTCGIGDASVCKKQGGGCCTDLNSYFITLARARGIPARLNMGYRLQAKNADKNVDPGYRCWVEYFVPNFGWISADVVEADTPGGLGAMRWFSGLTSRRIWLNQGREFDFGSDLAVGKVNHMSIGYAEVDGAPVRLLPEGKILPQLTRTVLYTERPSLQ